MLLPKIMQFRDEALSLPLGAARKPVAPPKWDPVWLFNHGDHPAGTVDDYTPITEADCRQVKGAKKARTVDDVCTEPTDEERDYIMNLRGGCRCMDPGAHPPCGVCCTPYTDAEAQEALEETSQTAPPPSTEKPTKFKVGALYVVPEEGTDWYRKFFTDGWGFAHLTHEAASLEDRAFIRYAKSPDLAAQIDAAARELVSPSEPKEADGWVTHDGKSKCPVPAGTLVEVRLRTGGTFKGKALMDVGRCVSETQWYDTGYGDQLTIVAYRLVKQQ